jgi:hypothetical protein
MVNLAAGGFGVVGESCSYPARVALHVAEDAGPLLGVLLFSDRPLGFQQVKEF